MVMLVLALVWGSSFILIKKSLLAFDPYQVASLRITIASCFMAPFFPREWKKVSKSDYPWLAIVGLAGTGIPAFCYPLAETQISSMTAGILNSMTPVFTLLLGVLLFNRKSSVAQFAGVVLGLVGTIMIITQAQSAADQNIWYGLFILLGSALYAISGNTIGARLTHLGSLTIGVVAFSLLGLPAVIYLFCTDFLIILKTHPEVSISLPAVAFLSIFGTAAASVLYFKLVHLTSAVYASLVAYLIPIVAIFFGLLDGEVLSIYHLIGLVFIASGIYLTRRTQT